MQPAEVNPFSPRGARLVGATAWLSLLAAFALMLVPGDHLHIDSVGADSFSRSAIGYRTLVALLRELGHDVRQRRTNTGVDTPGLLVLAEPALDQHVDLDALIDRADRTLLVLQKRRGKADPARKAWIGDASADEASAAQVLERLARRHWGAATEVARVAAPPLRTPPDLPTPAIAGTVQYLPDPGAAVEPMIGCADGVLLARRGRLYVLTDPDVLENHGVIGNAAFAAALFEQLAEGEPITFDETIHGHKVEPSLWHAIGSYPLVLLPVHLLLLFALVLWTARGRFGPLQRDAAAIAPGKAYLIDNVAGLLQTGSSLGPSLRTYAAQRVFAATQRLGAPPGLDAARQRDWLIERAGRHGLADDLRQQLDAARTAPTGDRHCLQIAREVQHLTEELVHGRK